METHKLAYLERNADGSVKIDDNGNMQCVAEDGTTFELKYADVNFNCENLQLSVDKETYIVALHISNNDKLVTNKEEKVFSWNDSNTKLFLSLYKESIQDFIRRKVKTKKNLWEKIAHNMQLKNYNVTPTQVENKYKSLKRGYINMISHNKKTGRARIACAYETELSKLLCLKHNIEPPVRSGRHGLVFKDPPQIPLSPSITNQDTTMAPDIQAAEEEEIRLVEEGSDEILLPEATTTPIPTSAKQVASKIYERKRMSATARYLDNCQRSIQQFTENAEKHKLESILIQKDILEEYKEMRKAFTECTKQLEIGNELKREKIELLKILIEKTTH